MIERALFAAMIALALLVLTSVAQTFHPLQLAANIISATSCADDGWSEETCSQ